MEDIIVEIKEEVLEKLSFVVIIAKYKGQYIFCHNLKRPDGYELAGGHIEEGESEYVAAKRELEEETAALDYHLEEITKYSVFKEGHWSHGALFYAEVYSFKKSLDYEIDHIVFLDEMPKIWNFKEIQSVLMDAYLKKGIY